MQWITPRQGPHLPCEPDGSRYSREKRAAGANCLASNDLPGHPRRRMSLRLIASWSLRPKSRIWVAALCATVAITASGVPCLCVCLGHAAGVPDHASSSPCHHSASKHGDAEHHGDESRCPATSTCMQNQAPAISTQIASLGPSLERSTFACAIAAPSPVLAELSVLQKARAPPDRSPPTSTSKFQILRL